MIKYKDFSIKTKLFTLTIIPLIFIIILSSLFIYKEYKNKNEYSTLKQLIKVDSNISLLLHEIQKERGMSVGYIGSNAKEFKNKLIRQREKTNNQIKNFENSFKNLNKDDLSTHSLEIVNNVFDEFRSLQNIRNRIDNLELSTKKALNYYTLINSLLLDFIARTSSLSHDTSTTKEILSFYNFLMTKEKAGIERAIGASTLAKGSFQDDMFSKFTSLISTQNQYLKQFRTYAIDEHLNYVDNKLKDNSINEVQKIRDILTNSQKKLKLIILMQENIGYGGIIHDFKNFVLRKDFKYKNRVENKYKTLKELIKKYKNDFFISNRELKLLNRIEAVFKEYYTGLNVIENSIFKNVNTTQIDKLVKVDDTPAIEAIHELKNKQFDIKSTVWFDTISKKIEILKQIDDYLSKELSTKVANKYDSVSTYFYINVIVLIIALIVIFLLTALIYTNISKSAKSIYTGIERFMRYINREINEIKDIEIHGNDEFGKIAEMANKNMKRINDDLEEDMLCVGEAILVLNRMREGYFNCRIKSTAANPQIQTFVYSVNKTLDIQKTLFDEILQTLNSYTNYDYTKSIINQEIKGDMAKLLEGINSLKESITQMLLKNQDVGLTLKSSSGVLLKNVDILNKSSNDAAVKLEETVAALDEISGNITSTNTNVKQMSQNAKILTNSSTEGKNLANQTTESMEEINRQVEAINEAITLIDQIAFQTNILSLNAAVEAATAGEAGKGFAVVAQEVRNLASRSAEAANKIKQIVENATEKSAKGKTIASSMIEGYNRLNENVQKTVSLIENIQSASAEQTEGINQINDALNSLDKQTQQNANVATQTNDIAHEASNIAKSVVKNVKKNNFKGKLEDL